MIQESSEGVPAGEEYRDGKRISVVEEVPPCFAVLLLSLLMRVLSLR